MTKTDTYNKKFNLWQVFWKRPDIAIGIEIDEIVEFNNKFNNFIKSCEKYYIPLQEIYKKKRFNKLKEMFIRKEEEYQRLRDLREPFSKRKEMINQMKIIEEMLNEDMKFKRLSDWLEPGDIEDIKKNTFKKFYWIHFTRSYETIKNMPIN